VAEARRSGCAIGSSGVPVQGVNMPWIIQQISQWLDQMPAFSCSFAFVLLYYSKHSENVSKVCSLA